MQIKVIVPTSDARLAQLPWLLLGLRQQSLEPEHWSLLIVHCGAEEALEQALAEFRGRIRERLAIQTLVLAPETTPGQALEAARPRFEDDQRLLFLQPGFQPQRNLLEIHRRFHQLQAGPAVATGSSQFHPEQALTRFAMAAQLDQLLFNFFPLPVQDVLPYTACHFHNLSLPASLLPQLSPQLQSWHFCGWELGLRLWRQGLRLQGLHEARSCLVTPVDLDLALNLWLSDVRQDLGSYLLAHPFPIPGWELDWPETAALPPAAALEQMNQQLYQRLRQGQSEISIPIERGDPVEQALQAWRVLLRQLWRGKALQVLAADPRKPEQARPLCPLPWRQPDPALVLPENPQPTAALDHWRSRDGAALAALAARYPGACLETGERPSFLSALGVPFVPWQELDATRLQQTELVFLGEAPFDGLLRSFLQLEQLLPPRSLLVPGPLSLPAIAKLQRLILENYPWVELDRLGESAMLCRLGPDR